MIPQPIFITMLVYQIWGQSESLSKIRSEVTKKLRGRATSWFPMGSLPYLEKMQREVLRLYPSVPVISRDTTREVSVGGYKIPSKSTLLVVPAMINRNPKYYRNPLDFNPMRMDPSNEDFHTEKSSASFLPFGYGLRHCIGQWFAQAEARSLVALFIRRGVDFTFCRDPLNPVELSMACTGIPSQKILASLQKRGETETQLENSIEARNLRMTVCEKT